MKDKYENGRATSGVGVQSGLSSQSSFSEYTPKSLGMDNKGPGQVPMSTPKKTLAKGGKKFVIC